MGAWFLVGRAAEEEGLLVAEGVFRWRVECGEDAFVGGRFAEARCWGVGAVVNDVGIGCARLVVVVVVFVFWLFEDSALVCVFAA